MTKIILDKYNFGFKETFAGKMQNYKNYNQFFFTSSQSHDVDYPKNKKMQLSPIIINLKNLILEQGFGS